MPEMVEKNLLGWDILFEISDQEQKFGTDEINLVALGLDVNSGVPMVTIKYKLDTSFSDMMSKMHIGTLTVTNKNFTDDEPKEIFKIELQSVVQSGKYIRREQSPDKNPSYKPVEMPIRYYSRDCAVLNQKMVGGCYNKKKLEDIIKDLYKKTGCALTLDLKSPDNKKVYENVFVPQCSFTAAVKNLNHQYGLYNSQLIMYGDVFISDNPKSFIIASADNIKSEEVNLHNIPDDMEAEEQKKVTEKEYYTYIPINLSNSVSKIMQQIPKKFKCISLDDDKFLEEKIIDVKKELSSLKFLKNSDQFQDDKNYQQEEMLLSVNRRDNKEFTIHDAMQRIASGAIQTNVITIPNPYMIKHWRLGNIINYTSEHESYIATDVKFFLFGTLFVWAQTGRGSWQSSLKVRLGAASITKTE